MNVVNEQLIELQFKEPTGPVTPGQAAVIYLEDEVLGGGWIDRGI